MEYKLHLSSRQLSDIEANEERFMQEFEDLLDGQEAMNEFELWLDSKNEEEDYE